MTTEAELKEKLLKIEALFVGATTVGERDAAQAAREQIQAKLRDMEGQERAPLRCASPRVKGGTSYSSWRSAVAMA